MTSIVRTRIAPSPTGHDLHIGNLYTALINWIWAKKHNGSFIVRIEDTDRTRLVKGSIERILKTLNNYGIKSDEGPVVGGKYGPYKQSQRINIYKKYVQQLISQKHAYYCFCSSERINKMRKLMQKKGIQPKYDRYCLSLTQSEIQKKLNMSMPFVIRMKIPKGRTTFTDVIRGTITIDNSVLDDQIILKSDGFPTYHLAVVVDDHLMKITHVVRGEDWISSTPKHILLYKMFGWKLPVFAHTPLLRNPDKSKLSKRKNPVWSSWYLQKGYLPEAILNYLALMGWSHPNQKEIFNIKELMRVFDLKDMQPVGPVFDITKLTWMNSMYIRKMPKKELAKNIYKFFNEKYSLDLIEKTVPLIVERIKTLAEYDGYCSFFLTAPIKYEMSMAEYKNILNQAYTALNKISIWDSTYIGKALEPIAQKNKLSKSKFFMIMRVATTGRKITPPLNESMAILGKKECLARIKNASFS